MRCLTTFLSTTESRLGPRNDGEFRFEVVGESHYQTELERIVGGPTKEGAHHKCVATLTPEPDNPHDPQAVCVSVDGCKVGYLSRHWARKFNAALASNGYARAECNALIVGGRIYPPGVGGGWGVFAIKLDITLPFDLRPAT
jgi:hypothetical protein